MKISLLILVIITYKFAGVDQIVTSLNEQDKVKLREKLENQAKSEKSIEKKSNINKQSS